MTVIVLIACFPRANKVCFLSTTASVSLLVSELTVIKRLSELNNLSVCFCGSCGFDGFQKSNDSFKACLKIVNLIIYHSQTLPNLKMGSSLVNIGHNIFVEITQKD